MDLFNKKKLAALQNELDIATANLEATSKELDDLKRSVLVSYKLLTDYFKPKYIRKYYQYELTEGETVHFKCNDIKYDCGFIHIDCECANDPEVDQLMLPLSELKDLKIITKQQFLSQKGGNE